MLSAHRTPTWTPRSDSKPTCLSLAPVAGEPGQQQWKASACWAWLLVTYSPTAQALLAEFAATPSKSLNRPVPGLDERQGGVGAGAADVVTHRPDVAGRGGRHRVQPVGERSRGWVRAGH